MPPIYFNRQPDPQPLWLDVILGALVVAVLAPVVLGCGLIAVRRFRTEDAAERERRLLAPVVLGGLLGAATWLVGTVVRLPGHVVLAAGVVLLLSAIAVARLTWRSMRDDGTRAPRAVVGSIGAGVRWLLDIAP